MPPRHESGRTTGYFLPITIGSFFRELIAVTLLILLQERAWAYDFFTPGLVLFLVLITFRAPYINSYILMLEAACLGSWKVTEHVGLRKHSETHQNLIHVAAMFVAHIGGAIAAAALRVYFDVLYGKEIMYGLEHMSGMKTTVAPALEVDVDGLRKIDSFWGAETRLDRLAKQGIFNGTIDRLLPFDAEVDLGVGSTNLVIWYTIEEVGYVFLLCICYIHIWMAAGVGEHKRDAINPYMKRYWKQLFRTCLMVTLIYISLYRAFPTAHGSLHTTIFRIQYQNWNPNVRIVDTANNETFARIFGGLLGILFAAAYNMMLVGVEKIRPDDDSAESYYKMVWGMEPDPAYSRIRRNADDVESGSDHSARSKRMYVHPNGSNPRVRRNADYCAENSDIHCSTFNVTHCKNGGQGPCSSTTCTVCNAQMSGGSKKYDFKLRIPHTLDHPK